MCCIINQDERLGAPLTQAFIALTTKIEAILYFILPGFVLNLAYSQVY